MSGLVDVIQKIVEKELSKIYIAELGVVTSIFPHESDSDKNNYECNVKLKNGELELRKVPVATQHIGLAYIPKVGDLVLINFIDGNINSPIIVGRLYNDEDKPPLSKGEEVVYVPPYSKNTDLKRIYIKLPSGLALTMNDDYVNLEAGNTKVEIKVNGDVTINSKDKLVINAENDFSISGNNIKIESKGNMEFKADGNVKVKSGGNLDMEPQGNTKIETGGKMDLTAAGVAKLEASGILEIKGSMVKIN
jgi:phage baseplate assembly protein gpV